MLNGCGCGRTGGNGDFMTSCRSCRPLRASRCGRSASGTGAKDLRASFHCGFPDDLTLHLNSGCRGGVEAAKLGVEGGLIRKSLASDS